MDYYPQPRPVLYGTSEEARAPQTLTDPVRIGPPCYPPAPPFAGDAPEPFNTPSGLNHYQITRRMPLAIPLSILYGVASVYSLMQLALGDGTSGRTIGSQIAIVIE